ncbi:hypothetical protein HY385_02125 [Candidatus Daviesbacteria bacterium]|nr:hypothetical protein [Candidatus Daviesbacteria bacterium]
MSGSEFGRDKGSEVGDTTDRLVPSLDDIMNDPRGWMMAPLVLALRILGDWAERRSASSQKS